MGAKFEALPALQKRHDVVSGNQPLLTGIGKEGYGDPSGEKMPGGTSSVWSARSAAQGALRWHHTAQGMCSSWTRITVKNARQSSSMQVPGDSVSDCQCYGVEEDTSKELAVKFRIQATVAPTQFRLFNKLGRADWAPA